MAGPRVVRVNQNPLKIPQARMAIEDPRMDRSKKIYSAWIWRKSQYSWDEEGQGLESETTES